MIDRFETFFLVLCGVLILILADIAAGAYYHDLQRYGALHTQVVANNPTAGQGSHPLMIATH